MAKVIVNDFDLLRENIRWSVVELIYNIPGRQMSVILFITTKSFNKDRLVSLFLESWIKTSFQAKCNYRFKLVKENVRTIIILDLLQLYQSNSKRETKLSLPCLLCHTQHKQLESYVEGPPLASELQKELQRLTLLSTPVKTIQKHLNFPPPSLVEYK